MLQQNQFYSVGPLHTIQTTDHEHQGQLGIFIIILSSLTVVPLIDDVFVSLMMLMIILLA